MRVLTAGGRMVVVPAGKPSAGLFDSAPAHSRGGSVPLLADADGRRRRVRYALIARTNPWVMAAVNARAGLASRVPVHVFRPDPQGREGHRERARAGDGRPGSSLARLLTHPEARLSGRRGRRQLIGDVLVHGNGLAELERAGSEVQVMRWQPWVGVDPRISDDGLTVEAFKVPTQRRLTALGLPVIGETRPIDRADTLHLTINDDTETPLGVSPLAALHATHALHDAAWRFARSYLEEGMFPSGVVELPHQATVAQAKATRELLEDLHIGIEHAGRPAVLGFGTWKQVTATPEGAQLIELAKASREEVSGAYRVPMTNLGDLQSANKATAQTGRLQFIRDVVGEDVAVYETEVNAQVVQPQGRWAAAGVFVEAQLAELLRPDPEALSHVIRREVGAPVLTPNEGRRLLNYPPLDGDPRADELVLNPGTPGPADPSDDGEE